MASHVSVKQADRDADHNFLPDLAWAAVGGVGVLAACAVVFLLVASWGGPAFGAPTAGNGAPALASYYRELAAGFLAGFLVILVARSLSARAG